MIIDDVRFELKDGREAILRSPKEEDVESTLEYLVTSAGETDYILRYPEECGKYTAEGEKTLFEQKNASPNEAMIMCIVEGKVVGNCGISFFKGMKTKHRASIGIALISDFWNQGIGTKMPDNEQEQQIYKYVLENGFITTAETVGRKRTTVG